MAVVMANAMETICIANLLTLWSRIETSFLACGILVAVQRHRFAICRGKARVVSSDSL